MDDSFRVRVDRIFGSLNAAADAGVSSASSWCLSDDKVERREWRRHKDDDDDVDGEEELGDAKEEERIERGHLEDGVSGSFVSVDQFESDLQELSEGGEEDEEEKGDEEGGVVREKSAKSAGDDASDDFLDVRANIGRDCTLDHEEEEDEYDKVAVGKDHTGDRLYMKDVKHSDYEIEQFTVQSELPSSFHSSPRDPRANHEAAKARLKEDAETAGDFHTLQLSENALATPPNISDQRRSSEPNGEKPKPILKRKENLTSSRSQKRVRFSMDNKSSTEANEEADDDSVSNHGSAPELTSSNLSEYSTSVPDYVRNPSNYTRYTFDSTDDLDDRSNRKAYMDLFNQLRKKSGDDSSAAEDKTPSKSIVFTPRKKSEGESTVTKNESECVAKGPSTLSEADEAQEKASAMEEDEQPSMAGKQRQSRHYRTKTNADGLDKDDEDNMQG